MNSVCQEHSNSGKIAKLQMKFGMAFAKIQFKMMLITARYLWQHGALAFPWKPICLLYHQPQYKTTTSGTLKSENIPIKFLLSLVWTMLLLKQSLPCPCTRVLYISYNSFQEYWGLLTLAGLIGAMQPMTLRLCVIMTYLAYHRITMNSITLATQTGGEFG